MKQNKQKWKSKKFHCDSILKFNCMCGTIWNPDKKTKSSPLKKASVMTESSGRDSISSLSYAKTSF